MGSRNNLTVKGIEPNLRFPHRDNTSLSPGNDPDSSGHRVSTEGTNKSTDEPRRTHQFEAKSNVANNSSKLQSVAPKTIGEVAGVGINNISINNTTLDNAAKVLEEKQQIHDNRSHPFVINEPMKLSIDVKRSMDFFQFDFPLDPRNYLNLHTILSNVSTEKLPNGTIVLKSSQKSIKEKNLITRSNFYDKQYHQNTRSKSTKNRNGSEDHDTAHVSHHKRVRHYRTTDATYRASQKSHITPNHPTVKQLELKHMPYGSDRIDPVAIKFSNDENIQDTIPPTTEQYQNNLRQHQFFSYDSLDDSLSDTETHSIADVVDYIDPVFSQTQYDNSEPNETPYYADINNSHNSRDIDDKITEKDSDGDVTTHSEPPRGDYSASVDRTKDTSLQCSSWHHTCSNGHCIEADKYCDGVVHCDDYSDELPGCTGESLFYKSFEKYRIILFDIECIKL